MNSPQICKYTTGGAAIHKLHGSWSGKVSAYVDKDGKLLSADHIVSNSRSTSGNSVRSVREDTPLWNAIQKKVNLLKSQI